MADTIPELTDYLGKVVIVDTSSPYVYIGTLKSAGAEMITLRDADVHDKSATTTTKEVYAIHARTDGFNPSRTEVKIFRAQVVSLSKLEDVIP